MKEFFSYKSVKILIATLSAVVVAAILGATGNPWISSGFNALTKGLSQVTAAASDAVGSKTYDELKAENEKLSKEAADLRAQLVDYYDLKDENARLWKYYKIKKEHSDYEIMPASVIRRDTGEEFHSFTIDAGTAMGVSEQDPVITSNGLIGFISSANAASAKVTTVLSPDLKAGALCKRTKDAGVISGNIVYTDKNMTTLTKIDANATLKKGDLIVTSGIGGVYPSDLIIGRVDTIKYDEYDATKYAVVESFENIKRVTDVVVLTDFKNKGEVGINKGNTRENR